MMTNIDVTGGSRRPRRRLLTLVPMLVFGAIGVLLAIGLTRDPGVLPSVLVGKPVPVFALPPLRPGEPAGLASSDLKGQPMLVNVFASWCGPCRIEHPLLARLAEQGIRIQGINYKDKPEDARRWLADLGDPFERIGSDRDGRVGVDWGVYGVPETFVIYRHGNIAYRHVGPLQGRDLEETILPVLERLAAAP